MYDGGVEHSSGVIAGLISRSDRVFFPTDCISPAEECLKFCFTELPAAPAVLRAEGGVSFNSRRSQSTIRPSRSYGGRSPDADGGDR